MWSQTLAPTKVGRGQHHVSTAGCAVNHTMAGVGVVAVVVVAAVVMLVGVYTVYCIIFVINNVCEFREWSTFTNMIIAGITMHIQSIYIYTYYQCMVNHSFNHLSSTEGGLARNVAVCINSSLMYSRVVCLSKAIKH